MDAPLHVVIRDSDLGRLERSASMEERLRFALRCAVLAPSNHNAQPWRFIVGPDSVSVCADRPRALPVSDPFDREAWLAAGQALERMLLVATRAGLTASCLNQPIEIAGLREQLAALVGLGATAHPQLLLRVAVERMRRIRRGARSPKSCRDGSPLTASPGRVLLQ